ncbi:hypothetical protein HMPREF3036_02521 [Sutterella sp. KLE1602]|nr:hypothetical protein HMPREF3036_02521 [Sutterella sp. KLE1602]
MSTGLRAVSAEPAGIRQTLLEKRSTYLTELRKEDGASSPV